ncbi:MAG: hypothetical protein PHF29_04445 [Candidatus Riflebacteria bacterium]|nr:hypothetical protein [Candidatus Riflebacteria bacterium]
MNKKGIVNAIVLLVFCTASSVSLSASGSGLILPMPGQTTNPPKQPQKGTDSQDIIQPAKVSLPNNTKKNSNAKPDFELNPDKIFIPLPEITKDPKTGVVKVNKRPEIKKPTPRPLDPIIVTPAANKPKPNVQIIVSPVKPIPADIPASSIDEEPDCYPVPSNEITVSGAEVAPPMITTDEEPQIVVTENSGELTLFPKDTGSAIFMVMKSWKCDDYDAGTLLEHAVGVYAGEADDPFQIKGLPVEAQAYDVTIEEEDITLDELLDIVAQKAGRDWGVDMNSRTIYFYPAGVRSNSYDLW